MTVTQINEDERHPPKTKRRMIGLAELEEELNVVRASIRRWLRLDGVRAYRFGKSRNSTVRYLRADVEAWLARRQEAS